MLIYIIENSQLDDPQIFFVQAPYDFGTWFDGVLRPWLRANKLRGNAMQIRGVCPVVSWCTSAISYVEFLADSLRFEEICYDRNPPEKRPRYRGA